MRLTRRKSISYLVNFPRAESAKLRFKIWFRGDVKIFLNHDGETRNGQNVLSAKERFKEREVLLAPILMNIVAVRRAYSSRVN